MNTKRLMVVAAKIGIVFGSGIIVGIILNKMEETKKNQAKVVGTKEFLNSLGVE